MLTDLQSKSWHLIDAAHRIWEGERDVAVLSAGLDQQDKALILQVLEMMNTG